MSQPQRYLVLGASGGPGLGVFVRLAARGVPVTGVGRSATKIDALNAFLAANHLDQHASAVVLDLDRPDRELASLVAAATILISASQANYCSLCLHMSHSLQFVAALGSTRVFSTHPDDAIKPICELETDISSGTTPGILLLPSMLYAGIGYNNFERIERLVHLSPLIPLPAGAARAKVQPIHTDDVVECLMQAIGARECSTPVVLVGPDQLTYRELVKLIAARLGRRVLVMPVPDALIGLFASLLQIIPRAPDINRRELLRAAEDKTFDEALMLAKFNVKPKSPRTHKYQVTLEDALNHYYEMELAHQGSR